MTTREALATALLAALAAALASEALAQAQDPTTGLQDVGEQGLGWMLNLASVIGAVALAGGGVLAYLGFIQRDWVKYVLVISGFIVVGPQIVKVIFDVAAPGGGLGGGLF